MIYFMIILSMRKVLILGCSHSLGSFKPDHKNKKNKEYLADEYSWWSFVDIIKNDKKFIYAGAGLSWMFWSQLIFDKVINLKDFDFCIIQNSHPNRLSIFKKNWHRNMSVKFLDGNAKWHAIHSPSDSHICIVTEKTILMEEILKNYYIIPYIEEETNIIKNISLRIENYMTKRRTNKFCRDIEESPTRKIAFLAHQYWLLNYFNENEIPVYIFNFGYEETFPNAITLNCHSILERLKKFRTHPKGHLTTEGNERVGNLVNKELCTYVN